MNISQVMQNEPGTVISSSIGPVKLTKIGKLNQGANGPWRRLEVEDASHQPVGVMCFGDWVADEDKCPPEYAEGVIVVIKPQGVAVTEYKGTKGITINDGEFGSTKDEQAEVATSTEKRTYHGATVGMAINQACEFARVNGKDLSNAEGINYVRAHTQILLKVNDEYETY